MTFFFCVWAISALGFFGLASSIAKHQKQYFNKELNVNKSRLATLLGWCGLIISLGICLSLGKPSNNVSYWFGAITLSALFVGLCTSYYAQYFKKIVLALTSIFIITALLIVF